MKTRTLSVVLASALAATLATGCYHVTTRTGLAPSGAVVETRAHMFLYGLVGHESVAPCPPAIVETRESVFDWFLGGITFGLYTPYSLTITCAAPTAAPAAPAATAVR